MDVSVQLTLYERAILSHLVSVHLFKITFISLWSFLLLIKVATKLPKIIEIFLMDWMITVISHPSGNVSSDEKIFEKINVNY